MKSAPEILLIPNALWRRRPTFVASDGTKTNVQILLTFLSNNTLIHKKKNTMFKRPANLIEI